MRIDLHCHSSVSDGTHPPAEVMRRARAAGLDVVALTDHDTQAGHEEARRALPPGLTLVPGMELSCVLDGHSVHMLTYLADPSHPGLAAQCRAIVASRAERAHHMVDRLRALGVRISWEQVAAIASGGVVGRPHIARAMAASGIIESPQEAFSPQWIGAGGRAYVRRYALDPLQAISLVRDAGGVTVLAHPGAPRRNWEIPDQVIARLAGAGLTGLEVSHPDHDPAQRLRLSALAARLGLVVSGGSDDHGNLTGNRIGCCTVDPGQYQRLISLAARSPTEGG